jgi:DNA-binding CsgD family transcriptional regulator
MCNNESVEKIHSFISACKEVEQMLLKGISRQEIGKLVSLGGRKKFWDNWPPGK